MGCFIFNLSFIDMLNTIEFPLVIQRGSGLDVHQRSVVATASGVDIPSITQTFGTFTSQVEELKVWLNSLGVTHIAMESTGIYWKPIFNILEKDFEIILVNARHIKNVPGHKTDKKDSAWISKLLLSGLLKPSFVPPAPIRELRELCRYKKKLIGQRVSERNRLHKVLEDANIKMASVMSDVFGVSGTMMINAIIDGQRDPVVLASMAKGTLRRKTEELRQSLEGSLSEHHIFMLRTLRSSIQNIESVLRSVEARIEEYAQAMDGEAELIQTVPGIGRETAVSILSEIGTDMDVFPSKLHISSWAGISPGNNESAGKKKSGKTTHGNKHLKVTLVEAAWAATRTKDTYYSRKYKSLITRKGARKALVAIAHKILVAVYQILKNREPYSEPDDRGYQEKRKQALIKRSLERLHELGVDLRLNLI